jgi:cell division protein FtsL
MIYFISNLRSMPRVTAYNRIKTIKNRTVKARTVSQLTVESKRILSFFLVSFVGVIVISYVLQMTSVSTKGYEIERYEKKLENLKKENQKLQIELADLNSIYNIEEASRKLSKVGPKDINYIISSTGVVAMER